MANRRSQNWLNQQRVDVPHLRSIESAVRSDFDELISSYATGEAASYILRGFEISMVGAVGSSASALQLIVDESSLFHGKSNTSGTFFQVAAGTPNETLNSTTNTKVDGAFTPNSLNYIGLELKREIDTSTVAQTFFWNPSNQTEFSKSAPLAQTLDYEIVITSTVWDSNILPLAIVQTDSSNAVLSVEDRRPMFFRLGSAGETSPDPFYEYPWDNHSEGRVENPFVSTSVISPFRGGDKQIKNEKEWKDAVMSAIKELKGTTYWYSFNAGGSIIKLRNDVVNTQITGSGKVIHSDATAGLINWDEDFFVTYITSRLQFKIAANAAPSTHITLANNQVAYIKTVRGVEIVPRLIFTSGSAIVSSVGAVPWTSDVQAGDFVKLAAEGDDRYFQIDTVDSASQVTLTEVWDGTSTGALGAISEYAWGTYEANAAPSTDRHIQIANREDVPFNEDIYWLFLRADNGGSVAKVYLHGITGGELEQGESAEIADNTTLEVLAYIGSAGEADTTPDYTNAAVTGVAEVTTYTFPAVASLAAGQSFNHNSSGDQSKYNFYVTIDGAGNPPAATGRVSVAVPLATGDNANQVAAKFQAVADAQSDLTAVDNLDGTVTVTNSEVGTATDAANIDMGVGFSITVDTQGAGSVNHALVDDENLTRGIKRVDTKLQELNTQVSEQTWKLPANDYASLPSSGNRNGDVRLTLDTRVAYHWDNEQQVWLPLTNTAGIKIIGGGTISYNATQVPTIFVEYDGLNVSVSDIGVYVNGTTYYAVSFTLVAPKTLAEATWELKKSAGTVGNVTLVVEEESATEPNGVVVATSDAVDATTITGVAQDISFNFSSNPVLAAGTYFMYLQVDQPMTLQSTTYSDTAQSLLAVTNDSGSSWNSGLNDSFNFSVSTLEAGSPALSFTEDMYLEVKGLAYIDNTILTSESPLSFSNDKDVAYVEPNLLSGGANLSVIIDILDNVPPTALIIARRDGNDIIFGTSSTRLAVGESIKAYDTKTDQDKDKMRGADYGFFRSAQEIIWTGTELQFLADIVWETINKDGTIQTYTVEVADSPLALANGEYLYLTIDRTSNSEILSFTTSPTIPALPAAGSDIIVFAKRIDALGSGYLHLPFSKQVLEPGQTVRIGASGTGGAGDAEARYADRLNLSPYNYVSTTIFSEDKEDYVDGASTGAYSPADKGFLFLAAAETLISTQQLDNDYLSDGKRPSYVELLMKWKEGQLDDSAIYEVSRNGGNEWQAMTVERIGNTDTVTGSHEFDNEAALQTLLSDNTTNANTEINTTTNQAIAQTLTVTNTIDLRELDLDILVTGSPLGFLKVKIVADDSNSPSTDPLDVLATANFISIPDLVTGVTTVDMADVVLPAGTYYIVVETDQEYKDNFDAGVDSISLRVNTGGSGAFTYDGAIWGSAANGIKYAVRGITLDLRLRVTSSAGDVVIADYGLFYDKTAGVTVDGELGVDIFEFSGNENRTDFTLVNISNPHPDLLEVFDVLRGQTYIASAETFTISGQNITFEPDFFDFADETIRLVFRQVRGAAIDTSDQNAAKIAEINNNKLPIPYVVKTLSATIDVDTIDIADLRLNNLEIGKTYRLTISPRTGHTNIADSTFTANHNGGILLEQRFNWNSNEVSSDFDLHQSRSIVFEATGNNITFDFDENGDAVLTGDGTTRYTFVMLEELPNHVSTTKWD